MACVIGDGEAETGPLAASWHSNKFLDPVHDGAVLPILHLNGYKIANPTVLARLPEDELDALLRGYGHDPLHVDRRRPAAVHRAMAARHGHRAGPDRRHPARRPRARAPPNGPRWPMIVLRTPKGWTGPAEVDGLPVEGTWRAHQVPLPGVRDNPEHLRQLEEWLRSYRPEELFDADGRPPPEVLRLRPRRRRAGSAPPRTPTAACSLRDLPLPALERLRRARSTSPGATLHEPTRVLGDLLEAGHGGHRRPPRLPAGRPRRDRLQPAAGRLRRQRQGLAGRDPADRRAPGPATAG